MSRWFLLFLIYSFLGYCLEKLFARVTHSDRQVRKCFLLLPLCPVYGLAMNTVTALAPHIDRFLLLVLTGGAVCTLAEYAVHSFYEAVFCVKFWDYTSLRGNVNGRICPQFTVIWGILSAAAARYVHPVLLSIVQAVTPAATVSLWIIFAADSVLTASLLAHYHDTELLSLSALLSNAPPANSEHPGRHTDGSSR